MSQIQDRLDELAVCLCAQIVADDLPRVCLCSLMPGDAVAFDYTGDCENACGMAWVRLATAYPSAIVGVPDLNLRNCSALLGFDVEVGIIRCGPVIQEDGSLPDPAEHVTSAELQIADMLAMRKAIACCRDSNNWILGTYTPVGPEGGVVGGAWTVSMQEV